ncbi:hypothetical protein OAJ95_03845 [Pelagibacteraceae bacterium]|nr:hypothetical protein [Pelagibacteraceae bacterium]
MKITVFTCNQPRHNYLINKLSLIADKIYVIQEVTEHKYLKKHRNNIKNIKNEYFQKVNKAELKLFGMNSVSSKNINILSIPKGEINNYDFNKFKKYLSSDLFVIFGSSILKNNLYKFLVKKNTYNIHMGISPYYRGTDCNFWALYHENYHLVGASIIKLSKKVDAGDIFYHDLAPFKINKFEYTMNSVKCAIDNFAKIVAQNKLKLFIPQKQNFELTLKISTKKDFNRQIIREFNRKKTKVKKIKNNIHLINNMLLKKICKV